MSDELERGEFQGTVLAKLDALKEIATEVRLCLKDHESRVTLLEHMAIRAKVWGTVAGIIAGFVSNKLPFFTGTKAGLYGATMGAIIFWIWPLWVVQPPPVPMDCHKVDECNS
jgi:hypothetical protein